MKNSIVFVLICVLAFYAQAQHSECLLPVVNKSGYYNVRLSPAIMQAAAGDFDGIRIIDTAGVEVPYLKKISEYQSRSKAITKCEVLTSTIKKDCCTELVFKNPFDELHGFEVTLRNAQVNKSMVMLGSDDQQQWYMLRDFQMNAEAGEKIGTTTKHSMWMPKSDYSYFKLIIDDSNSYPVEVTEITVEKDFFFKNEILPIQGMSYTISDSLNNTYIDVYLEDTNLVEFLEVEVESPKHYARRIRFFKQQEDYTAPKRKRKRKKVMYWDEIAGFPIRADHSRFFGLHKVMPSHFKITIANGDSPPLQISNIRVLQRKFHLTGWLEAGKQYKLKAAQKDMSFPNYDLESFRIELMKTKEEIIPDPLVFIPAPRVEKQPDFFQSNVWIWTIIILVLALLGGMSYKMLKENKEN